MWTKNKLNPLVTLGPGGELWPNWWEAAPSLLIKQFYFECTQGVYSHSLMPVMLEKYVAWLQS